jgi:uncharacterized delta-60 repeat protein
MHQTGKHCAIEPLESRRLLSAIAIDMNFGVQGRVVSDFGNSDDLRDAKLQSDGKLLVLVSGHSQSTPYNPVLVRYNPDGSRDQSFAPAGQFALPRPADNANYNFLNVLPDGKLMAGGTVFVTNATRFFFVRLNSDLSLDASFGSGGIVTGDFMYLFSSTYSFASLPDGKVLAAGQTSAAGNQAGIWRFNSDSTLDQTFGANGGGFIEYLYENVPNPSISSLLLNPDGSFFGVTPRGEAKFAANGVRDTSFGNQGYLPQGVTLKRVLSDGRMLGLQRLQTTPDTTGGFLSDILVSRWNPNGTPDGSFGNNGTARIDFTSYDQPHDLNLDSNGRIILSAGASAGAFSAPPQRFALARLLPDGQLDTSFGIGGTYIDQFGTAAHIVLPTADNKIMAVGFGSEKSTENPTASGQSQNLAITRYVPEVPINIAIDLPNPVNEGSNFVISGGGSSYDNGQIVRYEWNSSYDGWTFNTDAEGLFTVLHAGDDPSIPVALRVSTSDGLRGQATFLIPTNNLPPVANAGPDRTLLAGTATQLPMRADDAVKESGSLRVDYGDGTAQSVFNFTTTNPFTATPSHTYTKSGTYTLTLTADDGDGGISTDTATINVFNIIANMFQDTDGGGTKGTSEPVFPGRTVWVDLNDNGIQDTSEPESVTDANGDAFFAGLAAGTYKIRAQVPAGWQLSFADANFRGDYATATITATAGVKVSVGLTQRSIITGTVFNDANGNGVRDAGEVGISGQGIDIVLLPSIPINGGFSPVGGSYTIRGLTAGDYLMGVRPPSGWVQTLPAAKSSLIVSPGSAQTIGNIDFGLRQVAAATAKGFVFEDIDGDGANGSGDRAYYPANSPSPAPVYLDVNNNGVRDLIEPFVSISSTDSTWTMPQLPAGTYTFRFIPRPGWVQTFPANNGGQTVTLATGDSVTTLNFGLQKTDFVAPQVTSFAFNQNVKPNRIEITFSEPMVTFSSLVLQPVGGTNITLDVKYDSATNTATYTPRGISVLPDGNYRATFTANQIKDLAGNPLIGQSEWSFFVLKGDLNGDRAVSIADFIILSSNFGKTNASCSDGDINYDGEVGIADFIELSSLINTSLAPPAAAPLAAATMELNLADSGPSIDVLEQDLPAARKTRHHRRNHHRRADAAAISPDRPSRFARRRGMF